MTRDPQPGAGRWLRTQAGALLVALVVGCFMHLHEELAWGSSRPLLDGLIHDMPAHWGPYGLVYPGLSASVARLQRRGELGDWWRLAGLLAIATLAHLLVRGAAKYWLVTTSARPGLLLALAREVGQGLPFQSLLYVALLGVIVVRANQRATQERELERREVERQLVDAQLLALKSQLHPHFLFNTLHAIGSAARTDPELTNRMVCLLADLLRETLRCRDRQEVALAREVAQLQPYLQLLHLRYHDRLQTSADIPPECASAMVPDLLLLPLLENAVRHGIEAKAGVGTIALQARRDGEALVVEVRDDGRGPPEPGGSDGNGIGLGTTRARLRALHGHAASVTLAAQAMGGTIVTVRLPFRTAGTSPR